MSIAPVEGFPPARPDPSETPGTAAVQTKAHAASTAPEEPTRPVSGTQSKQQSSVAKNVPASYELPQDVVEVHQDPDDKSQIIIQYLDPAKNVILQVPSNQELDVQRAIAQEFDQAAKLRVAESAPVAGSEGEKNHGD